MTIHRQLDTLAASLRSLDATAAFMLVVVAAETTGSADLVEEASARYLQRAGNPTKLSEALLQTYLFAGFPAAIEAFKAAHRAAERVGVSLATAPVEQYDVALYSRRGARLFERIYGETSERVGALLASLSPALHQWTIVEGYGKVLSRPVLDIVERELCAVAALVAGGWTAQLRSHLRALARLGVERSPADDALNAAALATSHDRIATARELTRAIWQ